MMQSMMQNCYRFVIQDTVILSDIYATLMPRSCEGRSRRAVNVNTTVNNPSQLVWDVLYWLRNRPQRWLHCRTQGSTQAL
jgi:hypothetical protein